ncbi:hypothetical protein [Shimia sp.]|uniref:hypothetical protein n=1 Tax=Shimia sp. TaxID=1954381 RepID=UPI003299B834
MRFLPVISLVLATSAGVAPAYAASKKAECEAQAAIVTRATELRLERTSEKKALELMTSGEDEAVAEKYLGAVPAIVDWIYSDLKRKELKLDPGKAYLDTCLAQ